VQGRRCRVRRPRSASASACIPTPASTTNILLIPGTSSTTHLRQNIAGATLSLSDEDLARLDNIGR
jgi:aryl-alcohol dehydrogenase-like predicted oxidoreductase